MKKHSGERERERDSNSPSSQFSDETNIFPAKFAVDAGTSNYYVLLLLLHLSKKVGNKKCY